ncbi:MAG: 1,4-dihydroxy-6-naphthoate synthase [Peptococcaceae bacterium]|nr:MAG: 1,4-dihydroxy-6-naphthoate synthase [Peptococcaceae bacterium]
MSWTQWEKDVEYGFTDIIYEKKYHQELTGGVARITINRPEKLNAFTDHTQNEIFHAIYDASHDQMIGVIVLTGAGDKAFCTGGDVAWEEKGLREQFYWRFPPNQLVRLSRKPIIAAVKGWCIGGGNHLAYFCDFTIAADNAKFGQNGPRVASPADGYIVAYLTRVVGAKKAREMWMLCRRYTAQEALAMGLVNAVVPLDKLNEEVDKWCAEILSLSPGCIEILKASFDMEIDYMASTYNQQSRLMYPDWFAGPEAEEGPRAFLQKRKPEFWKVRKAEAEARGKMMAEVRKELENK